MIYLPLLSLVLASIHPPVVASALTSNLGPVVDIGYAAFAGNSTSPTGVTNSPVTFFGNIPYARPPLGDLRFRAPQPLNENAKAQTISDARNWGPPCIQMPAEVGVGSEGMLSYPPWSTSSHINFRLFDFERLEALQCHKKCQTSCRGLYSRKDVKIYYRVLVLRCAQGGGFFAGVSQWKRNYSLDSDHFF